MNTNIIRLTLKATLRLTQTSTSVTYKSYRFISSTKSGTIKVSRQVGTPYWDGPVPSPPKPPPAPEQPCPVCSYNEWGPLEEVIVGRAEGARIPKMDSAWKASHVKADGDWFVNDAMLKKITLELDEFQCVLELEGVKVRRPKKIEYGKIGDFRTPDFEEGGWLATYPRDSLLVVGNEIIEAPMSWRSRYFETWPFKDLLNEYFRAGAKWTLAPKPRMSDELYDMDYPLDDEAERTRLAGEGKYLLTEAEPCFDAADVVRFGRDLFIQVSNATNWGGVEWLRRHLAPEYRVHHINFLDAYAMHIDASLVPLRKSTINVLVSIATGKGPGFLLLNPEWPCLQIDFFKNNGWDIVEVPDPTPNGVPVYTSAWLSMNVLSLDEKRVIISSHERPLANMLVKYGFQPICVKMETAFLLGGAFHCLTCDVRRKGELKSYFHTI